MNDWINSTPTNQQGINEIKIMINVPQDAYDD